MALFFSSTREESAGNTRKFSLLPENHIETYRIWMFALFRDRPTRWESGHINACELCGSVVNARPGVTTLSGLEHDMVPDHSSRAA